MRAFLKWLGIVLVGLAVGTGFAIWQIRNSGLGEDISIGPWTTGRDIGTETTDLKTRAVVALRGLLALPKEEARYFTTRTDSAGQPLSGKCSYVIAGGPIEARWWSITLYDPRGWLVVNRWNRHSVGSAAVTPDAAGNWSFTVSPEQRDGSWIPTATDGNFDLTLRAYRPSGGLATDPGGARLPTITRGECRP
jgi:hypothetical protein